MDNPAEKKQIRDYGDINTNLRHWFLRLFELGIGPFYDIGANDGVFSRAFAGLYSVAYLFEADPTTSARLKTLLSPAAFPDALVVECALGDSPGEMLLYRYSDDSFNTLYPRTEFELDHYHLETAGEVRVPVRRLDDVVAQEGLEPPRGIKIDVEGAELGVLQGAVSTLSRHHPWIVVEYSVDNTTNAGYDRARILLFLEELGYAVGGLFRNEDTKLYWGQALESRKIWNLVAVHRSDSAALSALSY